MTEIIKLENRDGVPIVSSRDISERFGKEHKSVLKNIEGENRKGVHVNGLVDSIRLGGNPPEVYFIVNTYLDAYKRKQKEYLLTRDGFSLLVMGFTGEQALEWKLKYIEAFNKMETHLKVQNNKALPTTYKEALVQLLEQIEQREKLLDEVDRYQRFLCEKTSCLTKTELATKLDTKAQTLAATLKRNGVYTKTSQVSLDFLKQYPNLKLIIDKINTYVDPKTGETKEHKEWQWTHEGAKAVVDCLIVKGAVSYTDNAGFKLKS